VLRVSTNGGASWGPTEVVGANTSIRQMNDVPSIIWPTATTPYVLWNGWVEDTLLYRLYFRAAS